MPSRRTGVTIVELTAVLLVVALLAGAVVYAFRGELRAAQFEDATAVVLDLDRATRSYARASGAAPVIVVAREQGRLHRREGEDRISHATRLHDEIVIEEMIVAGADVGGRREVEIPCSPDGRTPSYAMRLRMARADAEPTWLLVAGLSGDAVETNDDTFVRNALARAGAASAAGVGDDAR